MSMSNVFSTPAPIEDGEVSHHSEPELIPMVPFGGYEKVPGVDMDQDGGD